MFWKTKPDTKKTAPAKKGAFPTVVTREMHILGNIVSDGVIDFDGTIDGNIRCQMLTVRGHGKVNGEIIADNVLVYGKVVGLIRSRHAHLFSSCHIEGIVMHESITIEDGAFIDGKCKRTNKILDVKKPVVEDDEESDSSARPLKVLENIRLIR
ncbi:MAG: polymer-forming cytoskeletal protein [Alphaproteobacteria bacterium]